MSTLSPESIAYLKNRQVLVTGGTGSFGGLRTCTSADTHPSAFRTITPTWYNGMLNFMGL